MQAGGARRNLRGEVQEPKGGRGLAGLIMFDTCFQEVKVSSDYHLCFMENITQMACLSLSSLISESHIFLLQPNTLLCYHVPVLLL